MPIRLLRCAQLLRAGSAPPTDNGSGLPCSIGDHAIISCAEQAFPAADGEGQDAFQFVVFRFVRPVHQSRQQAEAAGVVSGGCPD